MPNVHAAKKRKTSGDDSAIPLPDDRVNIDTEISAHPFRKSSRTNKSSKKYEREITKNPQRKKLLLRVLFC